MNFKKNLKSSIIIFFIYTISFLSFFNNSVYAQNNIENFNFFNFDWSKILDKFFFWKKTSNEIQISDTDKENYNNGIKINSNLNNSLKVNNNQKSINNQKKEIYIIINNMSYSESDLKNSINNQEEFKKYFKAFNYECIAVNIKDGDKFTMHLNLEDGSLKSIKKEINCKQEILLDDNLIKDIQTNGFKISNIKSYLEQISMPTMMYLKIIKIILS